MSIPLITRVHLKLQRIKRDFDPVEREFLQVWPLIQPIEGWLHDEQEKWLFRHARSLPNRANIVEIGSYKGRSTCCLAFGCRGTKKRVFAIDTFDGGADLPQYDSFEDFRLNVRRCQLSEYVEPVRGLSWEVAKTWDRPIHFLFVDGSHIYADVMRDFAGFFPHVVRGGLVAFHDVEDETHPGVQKAWRETIKPSLTNIGYHSTIGYGTKPLDKNLVL